MMTDAVAEVKPVQSGAEMQPANGRHDSQIFKAADRPEIANQAEAGITGKLPAGEVLAGLADWRFIGVVNGNIESMVKTVQQLHSQGKINQERANSLLTRVIQLREAVDQAVYPQLEKLVKQAETQERSGKADLFLDDLNIHFIREELKRAQQASDEVQIWQLTKDLQASEAERAEIKDTAGQPIEDQVVRFAKDLAGGRDLPAEFTDSPLTFIDSFFQKEFPRIISNENSRNKLASKLSIEPTQLLCLAKEYQMQMQINKEFDKIAHEINDIQHPGQKTVKELGRRGLKWTGIFAVITALMMFRAMKSEEQTLQPH